jgi:hypothetical protein
LLASANAQFGGHGMRRSVPASGVREANEVYDEADLYDSSKPLFFDDLWVRARTRSLSHPPQEGRT